LHQHPLYITWWGLLQRCENPEDSSYLYYGGRGIAVCDRWHDVRLFVADIEAEIGPRPEGRYPSGRPLYSLDRKDNNSDYGPGKVKWATAEEQQRNRRTREQADADTIDFLLKSRAG